MIRVQTADFSLESEYRALKRKSVTGAVVLFVGTVREFKVQPGSKETDFLLQHYPGMTENVLEKIEAEARSRWTLLDTTIVHRVGKLNIDDQIVLVGASSAHRGDAFEAAQFMIDILKTEAPFWKKEGSVWVEAKASDETCADRWLQSRAKDN